MLPEAVGLHSDLDFSGDTLCDGERSMGQDQVWLGPTSVGAIEGHDAVG